MDMMKESFWENKTLEELTTDEWERLCDGCAICCCRKLRMQTRARCFILTRPVNCQTVKPGAVWIITTDTFVFLIAQNLPRKR